jgi:hypothetical protein
VRASGSFGCCLGDGSGGGDRASPLRDRLRQARADVRNPRPPPGLREQFVEDRAAMRPASTPANDREPCPPCPGQGSQAPHPRSPAPLGRASRRSVRGVSLKQAVRSLVGYLERHARVD